MRRRIRAWLAEAYRKLSPPIDPGPTLRAQQALINSLQERVSQFDRYNLEREAEVFESLTMAGQGPWRAQSAAIQQPDGTIALKEYGIPISAGAYGDLELALQNVEWRREVQVSWIEFSRWGIEQIIRISRLYYIKNPIVRRLIDICAIYVFGRGYEVSSSDEAANEAIKDFIEDNKNVLGQVALTDLERRKIYDGNLFFAFFPDKANTGRVKLRTIDPLEILEIVTDPEDSDTPWLYRRSWAQKDVNIASPQLQGVTAPTDKMAWYPDIAYEPEAKPATIGGYPVMWDTPIYHRKTGTISKWTFGCPPIYPALDWAKESRKYLEAIASVKQSLSQIAMTWKTKGGQQAIQGIKGQMQTTVGPSTQIWDTNPTAVAGSTVVSGPGTEIQAFWQRGATGDPEEVRRYLLMCCMVIGIPETFLADVSTGNLATATTLDRPTELAFLEKQEAWREDLVTIVSYALKISYGAASGRLREAYGSRKIRIREAPRVRMPNGRMVYAKTKAPDDTVEVKATFPAIREGDIPQLIGAVAEAMTLGNKGGQVVGIDAKEGVIKLAELLDIPDPQEMAEALYPEGTYDPDRSQQELIQPIGKTKPSPGGTTQVQPDGQTVGPNQAKEAARLIRELERYANGVEHSTAAR